MQRRPSVLVPDIHIRTTLEERLDLRDPSPV